MNRFGHATEELDHHTEADFSTKDFDADFIRESESLCIKCGEMYLKDNSDLIFICTDCDERFDTVDAFKSHILVHYEVALQPVPSVESLLDDMCYETATELEELTSHCFDDNSTTSYDYNRRNETSSPFEYKPPNATTSSFDYIEETSYHAATASDEEFLSVHDAECSMVGEETVEPASQDKSGAVTKPVFECDVCKKTFSCQNGLRLHRKIHTVRERFNCDVCDMSYVNRMNLIIHKRRHTGEKPYVCMYCSERFITSTLRNKHQNEHTGRKPYSCIKCGACFATSMQLLNHDRNKHLDLRRFQCTACGKAFRQNAHLQAHYAAIHDETTRVKQKCEFCGATFKTKLSLAVHMKVHDGKKFKCRLCQKIYYSYSSVQAHLKRHKQRRD